MIDFGFGLSLRPLQRRNCDWAIAQRNSVEIRKWCRQNDIHTDEDQERWFESLKEDPTRKFYEVNIGDRSVGLCGLTSIDMVHRHAEFSLWIEIDYQGSGYAKKALATLVSHGFRNLGLNCIWGETFDGNPAAKLFEKLGFKFEGTRRKFYFKDGKFIDAHIYSMLAEEWQSKSQAS